MATKNFEAKLSSLGVKTKRATWQLIYLYSNNPKGKEMNMIPGLLNTEEPTIADVLKIDIEKYFHEDFNGQYLGIAFLNEKRTSAKTIHAIRAKLLEKGFDHNDGPFLYFGTKYFYTDKLMAKMKISKKKATEHVDIAIKMGWIKSLS